MNWGVIGTLVAKDISLYFRNRFFALVTLLALVAYLVLFFVMPASVDETIEIGLYAPTLPVGVLDRIAGDGLDFVSAPSRAALEASILAGEQPVGLVLDAGTVARLLAGGQGRIEVLFASALPEGFRDVYTTVFGELGFLLSGRPLAVEIDERVIGPDLAGRQIPQRERLLPLLAVLILMMETMGLASLISAEVEEGTLQALLVTPMSMGELFVGKGLTGVTLAFVQVVLLMAVTGGLAQRPLLVLLALLLGATLVTGVGFLMASVGKDLLSVMSWGILAMLLLMIPSLGILLPGITSGWVRAIPSHYLVDTVHRVANFGAGWGEVGGNLLALLAFSALFFWLGGTVLKRRFA